MKYFISKWVKIFFIIDLILSNSLFANDNFNKSGGGKTFVDDFTGELWQDYKNFYDQDTLMRLGIVFTSGAISANVKINGETVDERVRNWYQNDIRSADSDNFSKMAKNFGNGELVVPIAMAMASSELFWGDSHLSRWGNTATRAYLVGLPSMWLSERLTGASRPSENRGTSKFTSSQWSPMKDEDGVSGHAFVGAVPFLALSANYPDEPWIKYPAYVASTAAALSRVNDDKHYLSQAVLGWYFAYEAVNAVTETNEINNKYSVFTPVLMGDGIGIVYTKIF